MTGFLMSLSILVTDEIKESCINGYSPDMLDPLYRLFTTEGLPIISFIVIGS